MAKRNARLIQFAKENRRNATFTERLLWGQLRNKKMLGVRFHRQKPVLAYILDFYCPKASLCVEIDGDEHLLNTEYDQDRDRALAQIGIHTIRFRNREVVKDLSRVLATIGETMTMRMNARCATRPTKTEGTNTAGNTAAI